MSYQVLARKWRPQTFSDVVGQEHVLTALTNGLSLGRIHHAYLLSGTRGVGKTTIARLLAKGLNCETGITASPCGVCDNCREIEQGRFVDLIEIDAASRTKVEDTRDLLDNVQYAPARGRFKVYLIDEVHMLSRHSFNALLKTLEEPPAHVKFLLATTDPQKLPVTILSRCLQFHLKALDVGQIREQLEHILQSETIGFEPRALQLLARAADGSLRDALSLTDQAIAMGQGQVTVQTVGDMLGTLNTEQPLALIEALANADGNAMMAQLAQCASRGVDWETLLVEMLTLLHRIAMGQMLPDMLAEEEDAAIAPRLRELARQIPPADLQLYYQTLLVGRKELPFAPDRRMGVEMTLLRGLAFHPRHSETPAPTAPPEKKTVSEGGPQPAGRLNPPLAGHQPTAGTDNGGQPRTAHGAAPVIHPRAGNAAPGTGGQPRTVHGAAPVIHPRAGNAAPGTGGQPRTVHGAAPVIHPRAENATPGTGGQQPRAVHATAPVAHPPSDEAAADATGYSRFDDDAIDVSAYDYALAAADAAGDSPSDDDITAGIDPEAIAGVVPAPSRAERAMPVTGASRPAGADTAAAEGRALSAGPGAPEDAPAMTLPESTAQLLQARSALLRRSENQKAKKADSVLTPERHKKPASSALERLASVSDQAQQRQAGVATLPTADKDAKPEAYRWRASVQSAPSEPVATPKALRTALEHEKTPELSARLAAEAIERDAWAAQVDRLALPKLVQQLALNAFREDLAPGKICLHLRSSQQHLNSTAAQSALTTALSAELGAPVELTVVTDDNPAVRTPLEWRQAIYEEKLMQARQAIITDNHIQTLQRFFDAELDEDSIRPV